MDTSQIKKLESRMNTNEKKAFIIRAILDEDNKNLTTILCNKYLGHTPRWVDAETVSPIMPNLYGNPAEVGADRIVNAIAAFDKYNKGLVVIDFGTATTFDIIGSNGELVGYAGGLPVKKIILDLENNLFSNTLF